MAIQLSFWTNGYIGHGYSALVLGVGNAGMQALFTFDLPMYCDDTFSLASVVYINDDSNIKRGVAPELPYYVEDCAKETWLSTKEKDDPLYPCRICDWIFVLADLNEEGSIETIKKCAEAHATQPNEENKLICITFAEDEAYAKENLCDICDLLIFTDKTPGNLMRPVELILFDMYGGLVTLLDKGDVVCTLDRCHAMYHLYADFGSMEEAEKIVENIKTELQNIEKGENTIHAIVAGKGNNATGDFEYATSEIANCLWAADNVAIFQNKLSAKPIKSFVSLLYGLAPFEERSMLQAINLWYEDLKNNVPAKRNRDPTEYFRI